jgi:predicted DNA-binding transcriptional regulator AlpA
MRNGKNRIPPDTVVEAEKVDESTPQARREFLATHSPPDSAFIDEKELLKRLPVSRRTLFNYRANGKVPYVRLGGRRILFHWDSVKAALLRHQQGGGVE